MIKLKKTLNVIKYGKYNEKIFNKYKSIIDNNNIRRLKNLAIVELGFNLIGIICVILCKYPFIKSSGYLFNVIISSIFLVYATFLNEKKFKYTSLIFYIYIFLSLYGYKLIGVNYNSISNTTIVFWMYLIYSFMFVDKPYRFSLMLTIFSVYFCTSVFIIKPFDFAIINFANCIIVLITSCILNYFQFAERLEKQIMINKISEQRDTDHLTKLNNRYTTESAIDDYLKSNHDLCALYVIDLDNFKTVNDTYGHQNGDLVLKKTASCLRNIFRKYDYIARIGGDEFVVFTMDLSGYLIAERKAKELIKLINNITVCDKKIVGCSIGITYNKEDDNYMNMFERADKALYDAKEAGKNNYKIG